MTAFLGYHFHHWKFRPKRQGDPHMGKVHNQSRKLYCYDGPLGEDAHGIILLISEKDYTRYVENKTATDNEISWNEIGSFIDVTDVTTGEKWMVASAPCGSSCHCACVAVRPV